MMFSGSQYKKPCGSHSASEPASLRKYCDSTDASSPLTSKRLTWSPVVRPSSVASWPTPMSRSGPIGCRYAE
jgi:hypothetical protein